MNPQGKVVSLIYALLLLGCALFAVFDTWAFVFTIGDGGGQVGAAAATLLIATLVGGLGLVLAAVGSWSRWPGMSLIALVSALIVLPAAVLNGLQGVLAFWINTGMHYGLWGWGSAILPPFLDLVAARLSWVRFRRLSSVFLSGTTAAR